MRSTSLEEQVYGALGQTSYEQVGRAAIEAISILRAGTLVGAWFERRERAGRTAVRPQFALRIPGVPGECDIFDYGGRGGVDDEPRCPLISVFITFKPCVISAEQHGALVAACGPALAELKTAIDLILASSTARLGGRPDHVGRA